MVNSSDKKEPKLKKVAQEIDAAFPQSSSFKEFRIASASDLHLGHGKNPPEEMVERLKAVFPRNAETAKLDVIVLAGDVYDHLLNLPDHAVNVIDHWIIYMLRLCKAMDIQLWVLRGTPSHDRDQSERFELINRSMDIGCDLLYVDTLSIVWIPKFGINVLFVPDEWTDSAEKTLEEVHDLMRQRGIAKVDYAIMHGQFEYQLPPVVKAQKHSSSAYLKIVDKLIFIGHVHIHSKFDRIIAQGSTDRISHGEEGPKGHVRAIVRASDDYEIQFVETLDAKIFHTVNCRGLSFEESHEKVLAETEDFPDGSHIRIMADVGNPILQSIGTYEKEKPYYFWTGLGKADEDLSIVQQTELLQAKQEYVPIEITRDNVQKLIMDSLAGKNLDGDILKLAERKLAELV
ncbi:putative Nuclease SbcCD, D subunit [Ralstonia phage RP12]|uniref:Putative Nuclease SbcCD, D subunit n=1 Tax=Ralstonia phage RP12 TaxID=1923889 RepID=A0A1L7N1B1_9CAUD|nr:SbcD-like subunit of palindrome specific endonuclease [Ralstonia phage RP12]BAW19256.1 putative Nuclease SbcCD, D subunit [Ralstonia phage RP12]